MRNLGLVMVALAVVCLTFAAQAGARTLYVSTASEVKTYDTVTGAVSTFATIDTVNWGAPKGLALTADKLYVLTYSRLVAYNLDGSFDRTVLSVMAMKEGSGLAIDSDGYFYTGSVSNNQIVKISPDGSTYTTFGASGGLNIPMDLEFGSDGKLYVSSYNAHKVIRFNTDGTSAGDFATTNLLYPLGVTFGSDGKLYVANRNGNNVQSFDSSGAFAGTAAAYGSIYKPLGVAYDEPAGKFYVASANMNLHAYNADGSLDTLISAFNGTSPTYMVLSPVPEPSSLIALLTGGIGLLGFSRRRKR